jgi:hypothetical protein
VHSEIQHEKNKKQASTQLKYIKPFMMWSQTCELTVQKITINAFGLQRKPKEKAKNTKKQIHQIPVHQSCLE